MDKLPIIRWETANYSTWGTARIADFNGHRLYVKRAHKGARYFLAYVDGKLQGSGDSLAQACGMAERAARNMDAAQQQEVPL